MPLAKPRTTDTIVVRAAQKAKVDAALDTLKQGGYPVAALTGPLVDDADNEFYTLSGNFTAAQLAKLRAAFKSTRIARNTSYWEHEGNDTKKLHREKKLRAKEL